MNTDHQERTSNDRVVVLKEDRIDTTAGHSQRRKETDSEDINAIHPLTPSLGKSKYEGRRPMASLVHVLTLPFKQGSPRRSNGKMVLGSDLDDGPSEDEPSLRYNDNSTSASLDNLDDDMIPTELVETSSQLGSGKLIRRRRSKQFSKGRRANRKVRAAGTSFDTRMNASDGSWDKLLKLAEGSVEIDVAADE